MQPPDSENQALIKRYQGLVRELILLKTDHKREERLSKLASKVPPLLKLAVFLQSRLAKIIHNQHLAPA